MGELPEPQHYFATAEENLGIGAARTGPYSNTHNLSFHICKIQIWRHLDLKITFFTFMLVVQDPPNIGSPEFY